MSIFEKLFGGIKTGSQYKKGGHVPLDRDKSFRGGLEKLTKFRHSGIEGRNLSQEEVDMIGDIIEPHLKNIPAGHTLSHGTKKEIHHKIWQLMENHKISRMDLKDFERILDEF